MIVSKLFDEIRAIEASPVGSFNVISYNNCYYGVDKDKNIVFLTSSLKPNARFLAQQTEQLYLGQNIFCSINTNEGIDKGVFDILICFDKDPKHILTFLHLTSAYVEASKSTINNINTFFESLKSLFANKQQLPIFELQGLYGELYFINYMNLMGVDIGIYWQSQDKMKFDFSVNTTRKIEVKTTISETRKHKFRHEQLVSDIYDIWIVSFLLRKDDQGLSLFDLSEIVKKNNPLNFQLHIHIIKLLNNYTDYELKSISFNKEYADSNLRFYNTISVPKFLDKQPQGVTNAEYESDLTSVQPSPVEELVNWVEDLKKL